MYSVPRSILIGCFCCVPTFASGCSAIAARLNAHTQCKAETRAATQEFRQEERVALEEARQKELECLKAQLECERKALAAERDLQLAQMRAQSEEKSCKVASQYEESVRTQLGLDLDQRVKIGQLQVNTTDLQKMLAERERDHAERMRHYNQLKSEQQRAQLENWKRAQMGTCTCEHPSCDAPADQSCEAPAGMPQAPACCRHCGLPVCPPGSLPQYGNDCAGNRPFREAPMRPLQQPLTAAEIPMMLPVTIEVGMTNSRIDKSTVRRLPLRTGPGTGPGSGPGHLPLTEGEQGKPRCCGKCKNCKKGKPCSNPPKMPFTNHGQGQGRNCGPDPFGPSCESPTRPASPMHSPPQEPGPNAEPTKQIDVPAPPAAGFPAPVPPSLSRNQRFEQDDFRSNRKMKLADWQEEAVAEEALIEPTTDQPPLEQEFMNEEQPAQ